MVRRRVLLVGGDAAVAAVLREYFHNRENFEVESVEHCDDALATLLRRPVDLVLVLSLRVPWRTWPSLSYPARQISSESAIVFLNQVRALQQPVPVLIVSGAPQVSVAAEALRSGAFAFMAKPVNLCELDSLITRVIASETGGG